MAGIMADHNIEGHFRILILILEREPWKEIWDELNLSVETFESLGIHPNINDQELWHTCQVTANRKNGTPIRSSK